MPVNPEAEMPGSGSLEPGLSAQEITGTDPSVPPQPVPTSVYSWQAPHRIWRVVFALIALEIGLFLLVYPWMDSWNLNHLPTQLRAYLHNENLEDFWDDPYFRGAISGIGLVNLWICLSQVIGLVRRPK